MNSVFRLNGPQAHFEATFGSALMIVDNFEYQDGKLRVEAEHAIGRHTLQELARSTNDWKMYHWLDLGEGFRKIELRIDSKGHLDTIIMDSNGREVVVIPLLAWAAEDVFDSSDVPDDVLGYFKTSGPPQRFPKPGLLTEKLEKVKEVSKVPAEEPEKNLT